MDTSQLLPSPSNEASSSPSATQPMATAAAATAECERLRRVALCATNDRLLLRTRIDTAEAAAALAAAKTAAVAADASATETQLRARIETLLARQRISPNLDAAILRFYRDLRTLMHERLHAAPIGVTEDWGLSSTRPSALAVLERIRLWAIKCVDCAVALRDARVSDLAAFAAEREALQLQLTEAQAAAATATKSLSRVRSAAEAAARSDKTLLGPAIAGRSVVRAGGGGLTSPLLGRKSAIDVPESDAVRAECAELRRALAEANAELTRLKERGDSHRHAGGLASASTAGRGAEEDDDDESESATVTQRTQHPSPSSLATTVNGKSGPRAGALESAAAGARRPDYALIEDLRRELRTARTEAHDALETQRRAFQRDSERWSQQVSSLSTQLVHAERAALKLPAVEEELKSLKGQLARIDVKHLETARNRATREAADLRAAKRQLAGEVQSLHVRLGAMQRNAEAADASAIRAAEAAEAARHSEAWRTERLAELRRQVAGSDAPLVGSHYREKYIDARRELARAQRKLQRLAVIAQHDQHTHAADVAALERDTRRIADLVRGTRMRRQAGRFGELTGAGDLTTAVEDSGIDTTRGHHPDAAFNATTLSSTTAATTRIARTLEHLLTEAEREDAEDDAAAGAGEEADWALAAISDAEFRIGAANNNASRAPAAEKVAGHAFDLSHPQPGPTARVSYDTVTIQTQAPMALGEAARALNASLRPTSAGVDPGAVTVHRIDARDGAVRDAVKVESHFVPMDAAAATMVANTASPTGKVRGRVNDDVLAALDPTVPIPLLAAGLTAAEQGGIGLEEEASDGVGSNALPSRDAAVHDEDLDTFIGFEISERTILLAARERAAVEKARERLFLIEGKGRARSSTSNARVSGAPGATGPLSRARHEPKTRVSSDDGTPIPKSQQRPFDFSAVGGSRVDLSHRPASPASAAIRGSNTATNVVSGSLSRPGSAMGSRSGAPSVPPRASTPAASLGLDAFIVLGGVPPQAAQSALAGQPPRASDGSVVMGARTRVLASPVPEKASAHSTAKLSSRPMSAPGGRR